MFPVSLKLRGLVHLSKPITLSPSSVSSYSVYASLLTSSSEEWLAYRAALAVAPVSSGGSNAIKPDQNVYAVKSAK